MGQIAWSEDAERWLREIYEYIGEGSPQSALRTVAGIRERVQYLEFFPELGWRHTRSDRNIRIILYGHYRIAYLVHENQDVTVLGIFHTSMDLTRFRF